MIAVAQIKIFIWIFTFNLNIKKQGKRHNLRPGEFLGGQYFFGHPVWGTRIFLAPRRGVKFFARHNFPGSV